MYGAWTYGEQVQSTNIQHGRWWKMRASSTGKIVRFGALSMCITHIRQRESWARLCVMFPFAKIYPATWMRYCIFQAVTANVFTHATICAIIVRRLFYQYLRMYCNKQRLPSKTQNRLATVMPGAPSYKILVSKVTLQYMGSITGAFLDFRECVSVSAFLRLRLVRTWNSVPQFFRSVR